MPEVVAEFGSRALRRAGRARHPGAGRDRHAPGRDAARRRHAHQRAGRRGRGHRRDRLRRHAPHGRRQRPGRHADLGAAPGRGRLARDRSRAARLPAAPRAERGRGRGARRAGDRPAAHDAGGVGDAARGAQRQRAVHHAVRRHQRAGAGAARRLSPRTSWATGWPAWPGPATSPGASRRASCRPGARRRWAARCPRCSTAARSNWSAAKAPGSTPGTARATWTRTTTWPSSGTRTRPSPGPSGGSWRS